MSDPRDRAIDESARKDSERRELLTSVRARTDLAHANAKVRQLEADLQIAEERLAAALALGRPTKPIPPLGAPKQVKHRGAFVLLCSDWHVGERVDPDQVGGRNEYNPDIAIKRVDKLIEGARWMIEAWRTGPTGFGWGIDQVVVWLGGDMMTGMIHEDLAESNYLSPTEEVLLAQDLCIRLIESLGAHEGIRRVIVPTSWGNHGRDTPERRVQTAWKRSYEWLMYQQIARHYAGSDRILVQSGKDEISTIEVLGRTLRFNHGDQFRYMDGVGGLTIPARKWLAKLDKTAPADVTCIGHHHTYVDLGDLIVNNCLIGWGPFSQRVAPFSRPSQVAFLIDEKFGKRMSTEIVVG